MGRSSVYCDLAIEANSLAIERRGTSIPGVEEDVEHIDDIFVSRIKVTTEEAAHEIGKEIGRYISVHSHNLRGNNREEQNKLAGIIGEELKQMLGWPDYSNDDEPTTFVVGLGNWRATPDALGPRVVGHLLMTRHLYREAPPELRRGVRPVCGLAPGVLGLTGIETGEIVKGIIDKIKPDQLVVIDALSAHSMDRLGATVQVSDTGIAPGSGVGGRSLAINSDTMGIPVLAIGIPTVVHGWILADETLEGFRRESRRLKGIGPLPDQVKDRIIEDVLSPFGENSILTPKGIDELIEEVSRTLGGAINIALHQDITTDNLSLYLR